jgi:hypothetical protein
MAGSKKTIPSASRTTSGIGRFSTELTYMPLIKQWTYQMTLKKFTLALKWRITSEMEKVKIQVGFKGTLKDFLIM